MANAQVHQGNVDMLKEHVRTATHLAQLAERSCSMVACYAKSMATSNF